MLVAAVAGAGYAGWDYRDARIARDAVATHSQQAKGGQAGADYDRVQGEKDATQRTRATERASREKSYTDSAPAPVVSYLMELRNRS